MHNNYKWATIWKCWFRWALLSPTARDVTVWARFILLNNAISTMILINGLKWNIFTTACILTMLKQKYLLIRISKIASKKFTGSLQEAEVCQRSKVFVWIERLPVVMSREWARWWAAARVCHRLKTMCLHTHIRPSQRREQTNRILSQDAGVRCCLYLIYLHPCVSLMGNIGAFITLLCTNNLETSEQS